jgi:nitroreductase
MIEELIRKNRSYRRFKEDVRISRETLVELVDLARLSPSGSNLQPLKYVISCDPERNALIFRYLAWAGYLKDWPGPAKGERPAAYVIILSDTRVRKTGGCDHGIAAQSILLGAAEKDLGGCIIGSIDRDKLRRALSIPARDDILLVIALGKPAEKVVIEQVGSDGDVKYWRDDQGVHHVPKRSLDEIIIA